MATRTVQTDITPEEYIALERKALPDAKVIRSEYSNGQIIAMSGASFAHNLITTNLTASLHTRLKNSGCVVFANDMRVGMPSRRSYFYPDVGVVCGTPRFEDDAADILLNPRVVVEILSPSTEAYDRGDKFLHYQHLHSLQEYLLVSQDAVRVEHYHKHGSRWVLTDFQELEQQLPFPSLGCEIPVQEIYENVPFSENHSA